MSFLLVLLVSYGKQLKNRFITARLRPEIILSIPFQPQATNLDDLLSSPTIQHCNFLLWDQIIKLCSSGKTKSAIFLLLSQIEAVLRLIYGQLNEVDIIAQPDKYYIIMDSIFYEYILAEDVTPLVIGKINKAHELEIRKTNKRNRMMESFPSSLMHLGYDLFHAADGPRIRDKISHGEAVCNEQCDEILKSLLEFISLVVKFNDHGELPAFKYESIYMNNCKLVTTYNAACNDLKKTFENLIIPESLRIGNHKFLSRFDEIDSKAVKTFFRPFAETQIVKLLLTILKIIHEALESFSSSCNEYFRLYEERKLSSSRRSTLSQLVLSMPNFYEGFNSLLSVIRETFTFLQKSDEDTEVDNFTDDIIKLLKPSMKFSENIARHFSSSNRNFFVANEKTCEFLQLIDKRKHLFMKEVK